MTSEATASQTATAGAFDPGKLFPPRRVTPEWMDVLPCQQQSVVLLGTRGPDGVRKDHPCKDVTRAYRATVFRAAWFGRWLAAGERLDDFMSLRELCDLSLWKPVVKAYLRSVDELPHHYHLHLMHGAQILGYKHPDQSIRAGWSYFFASCCDDMHLPPESEAAMDFRLGDRQQQHWTAPEAPPQPAPERDATARAEDDAASPEALHEFVSWAMQEGSWQGHDLDGGDIQQKATDLGLLKKVAYDPELHGEAEFEVEPGDDWYLLKPLARRGAQADAEPAATEIASHAQGSRKAERNFNGCTVRVWRDNDFTCLYVKDGSGGCATVSMDDFTASPIAYAMSDGEARRFDQYAKARDALHELKYPDTRAEALRVVADEIDCQSSCDCCSQELDTGAFICYKEERGEFCGAGYACNLRALADALDIKAQVGTAAPPPQSPASDDGWLPIASAPKDGMVVDLWIAPLSEDGYLLTACRVPDAHFHCDDWLTWSGLAEVGYQKVEHRITHWRPLPPPPVSPQRKEGDATSDTTEATDRLDQAPATPQSAGAATGAGDGEVSEAERTLVAWEGSAYWLHADGSHRCLTAADVDRLNASRVRADSVATAVAEREACAEIASRRASEAAEIARADVTDMMRRNARERQGAYTCVATAIRARSAAQKEGGAS